MNKSTSCASILFFASALLLGNVATAQPGGDLRPGDMRQRGFGAGFGAGMIGLLANERVHDELELVDDQIEELKGIQQASQSAIRDMFSEMQDLGPEDRRALMEGMREKIQEKMKQFEEDANHVLLPHQRDRLKQLTFQAAGRGQGAGGALNNDSLLEELGVTDEQRAKIDEATEKAREELRVKYMELVRDAEEDILKALTSEQRTKYKELVGDSFEFQNPDGTWGRPSGPDDNGDQNRGRRGRGGERRPDF